MGALRRGWVPQPGAGSQCEKYTLHHSLLEVAAKKPSQRLEKGVIGDMTKEEMIKDVLDRLIDEIESVHKLLATRKIIELGGIYKNREGTDTKVVEVIGNPYWKLLSLTNYGIDDELDWSYFQCVEFDGDGKRIGQNRVDIYGRSKYGDDLVL